MTMGAHVRPRALVMNAVLVPLPAPGRAAEKNDFLWESQILAAVVGLKILPDRLEDQLGVLDLEIGERTPGGVGARLGLHWHGLGHRGNGRTLRPMRSLFHRIASEHPIAATWGR